MLIVYFIIFVVALVSTLVWIYKSNNITKTIMLIAVTTFVVSFGYLTYDIYRTRELSVIIQEIGGIDFQTPTELKFIKEK